MYEVKTVTEGVGVHIPKRGLTRGVIIEMMDGTAYFHSYDGAVVVNLGKDFCHA